MKIERRNSKVCLAVIAEKENFSVLAPFSAVEMKFPQVKLAVKFLTRDCKKSKYKFSGRSYLFFLNMLRLPFGIVSARDE